MEIIELTDVPKFTDELIIEELVKGTKPSELPALLGIDASKTAQAVRRALDSMDMVTMLDNTRISFMRMTDLSDQLAKGLDSGQLQAKDARIFLDTLKAIVALTNQTLETHTDLMTKVTDVQTKEMVEIIEVMVFEVADEVLSPEDSSRLKNALIERMRR